MISNFTILKCTLSIVLQLLFFFFFYQNFWNHQQKSEVVITFSLYKIAESVQALNIQEGDVFFALATFVSETGEAMNLVEGEKVHVLEWNNTDW